MSTYSYALFDTAIGRCGIGWGNGGIACVQLPEATAGDTRKRICERLTNARPAAPPGHIQTTIEAITALLQGKRPNLKHAKLDMAGIAPFHRRVYEITRRIEPGATLTYGDVAQRLGAPGAARAVGQALGKNPFAIIVPCHRVLAANGKLCGFSAHGGVSTKRCLLMIEGLFPMLRSGSGPGTGAEKYSKLYFSAEVDGPRAASNARRA